MVNQNTPYGSLTYTQGALNPDGTHQYTADTSLSPQMQSLVGSNMSAAQGNSDIENRLLGNVSNTLSQPVNLSEGADETRLNQLGRTTLDPQFQQANNQLEQKLYDQGLRPGTEAYDYAMQQQQQSQGQQYNNLYLQGHQTATNDAMAAYNQPINELSALRSNSQVSQPGINQTQTPQTSVAGTNISGLINSNYQSQLASSNAALGGLFGLGGTLGGAALRGGLFGLGG